jgi:hypothetical protein
MPLQPLTHSLSNFEQIEILRNEIEQFEEELKKSESHIRTVLYEIEKQRFLMTVHPVFQNGQIIPESDALPEMYTLRETVASALEAMKRTLAELEAASGGAPVRVPQQRPAQMPPRSPSLAPPHHQAPQQAQPQTGNPPLRKNRFDAF